jgi:hypothetical protein
VAGGAAQAETLGTRRGRRGGRGRPRSLLLAIALPLGPLAAALVAPVLLAGLAAAAALLAAAMWGLALPLRLG